jgi:hypothetical protein
MAPTLDSFFPNFKLDMKIRFGMGRDVNQQNSEPRTRRRLAENDENPPPDCGRPAKTRLTGELRPASGRNEASPSKNRTLDELQNWYEARSGSRESRNEAFGAADGSNRHSILSDLKRPITSLP